uniref:Uncharacterized mitochondrial protein AtMg00810-like n=1 Tax=Nicotiana tabacum TaxID=4097 RepID=A0A1S4A2E1_TOBAC|nr:PREDICTED: uncharacterized mitochondrial protein AtMg00810-like [Nicotiana tabacum]
MTTVRALVGIAIKKDWDIFQLDVNNAFLHGDLHEEVYMELPPGLVVERSDLHGDSVVFVAVYVDDVLIIGTDLQEIEALKKTGGKLNYLTNTRPDISYSVQRLIQYMQSPREPHLKVAYHVLRYLKGDPNLGIFLSNNKDYRVRAFCDSDWAACPNSRKSVSGYVELLGDGPINWKSKKQHTISLSSTEAEYRAARQVVGELVWLLRLLAELTAPLTFPVTVKQHCI